MSDITKLTAINADNFFIEFKSNLSTSSLDNVKKFIGTSHGLSMLGLSMLDPSHKDLQASMTFTNDSVMLDAAEQLVGVWLKCASNKVHLRSAKKDGEFIDNYAGIKLMKVDTKPVTTIEFLKNTNVILDCSFTDYKHVYTFHRWNELNPRILTLEVVIQ